jgi:hypothetical protein
MLAALSSAECRIKRLEFTGLNSENILKFSAISPKDNWAAALSSDVASHRPEIL